jgi:hypothetical protein
MATFFSGSEGHDRDTHTLSLSAGAGLPLSANGGEQHDGGGQSSERAGEKSCRGRNLPHATQIWPAKHRSPGRRQVLGTPSQQQQHTTLRLRGSMKYL